MINDAGTECRENNAFHRKKKLFAANIQNIKTSVMIFSFYIINSFFTLMPITF